MRILAQLCRIQEAVPCAGFVECWRGTGNPSPTKWMWMMAYGINASGRMHCRGVSWQWLEWDGIPVPYGVEFVWWHMVALHPGGCVLRWWGRVYGFAVMQL